MARVIIFLLFLFLFDLSGFSEIKIDLKTDNPSEIKNYVKNGGFEIRGFWKGYSWKVIGRRWEPAETINGEYTREEKFTGKFSYKIKGRRGVNSGISQGIVFDKPVKGEYIYLSYRVKIKGITEEGALPGPAIQVRYVDAESRYLPGISLVKGNYDWEEMKYLYKLPKKIKSLTLYLTYYDQEGVCFYDDVVLSIVEKMRMRYRIEGDGIKRVRIYSEDGLIRDTGIMRGVEEFEGNEEIIPVKNYYIEVEDSEGNRYVKVFPEIEKEVRNRDGEFLVGYISQETISQKKEREYRFNFEKKETKKYILYLRARLNFTKIAGHTNALKVDLNGETIRVDRLVDRTRNFTTADGRTSNIGIESFRVFYAPSFVIPPEDSVYFPVDVPGNDPYTFKFDITDILNDGENKIRVQNTSSQNPLVIKDLKIIER